VPEYTDILSTKEWLIHFNTVGIDADEGYKYGKG
jgi:hypothetical protein